jgi:hypothetical protein
MVRAGRLELPRPYGQQILSLPRLPFRHARSSCAQAQPSLGLILASAGPRSARLRRSLPLGLTRDKRSRQQRSLLPPRESGRVHQTRSPEGSNEGQNESDRYHQLSHSVSPSQPIGRGDAGARYAACIGDVENDSERRGPHGRISGYDRVESGELCFVSFVPAATRRNENLDGQIGRHREAE